jgi:mitofusin
VEGGNCHDPYVMTEDSTDPKSIKSIGSLGNALCDEKLESNAKVRIVWPKKKCKMLGAEVVLIDSPGIDVETGNKLANLSWP